MTKPLIVQSDNTVLLEVNNPDFENARDSLSPFAELEKSPEHIHTYRITPLSLWNAASLGYSPDQILDTLKKHSRYEVPDIVIANIKDFMSRYGLIKLTKEGDNLILTTEDDYLLNHLMIENKVNIYFEERINDTSVRVKAIMRGHIKQALIKTGFPVEDLADYEDGDPCEITLRTTTSSDVPFKVRDYQQSAINAFYRGGSPEGGSGVVVLPCGAGKTVVGLGIMEMVKSETLILVTNTIALRQWRNELLDKTSLTADLIGEYSGEIKEIKPITIATYNILTYRKKKNEDFLHFSIFSSKNWGLIVYDEVHLLPAPVFRMTAEIQSKRRLGLTATLVREDGMESDVFSLIGPKKYDMPWKMLEEQNWIAQAICTEVRISFPEELKRDYSIAQDRDKFRIASENPQKTSFVQKILDYHPDSSILIIGQYIDQLKNIASHFGFPLITGSTPNNEREILYDRFRKGEVKNLIVSKVANFAIDLPDANVAIQISGTFGSRQEEAQRLGRILRPKENDNRAHFYTIISANSVEERFSHNRQLFLTEQGYTYIILNEEMFSRQFG